MCKDDRYHNREAQFILGYSGYKVSKGLIILIIQMKEEHAGQRK